ncbi:MAG TPA: hypothetical protein VF644_19375 [Pyrinomonadaceae bacterium]|jgi:hypothetical protein
MYIRALSQSYIKGYYLRFSPLAKRRASRYSFVNPYEEQNAQKSFPNFHANSFGVARDGFLVGLAPNTSFFSTQIVISFVSQPFVDLYRRFYGDKLRQIFTEFGNARKF